MIRLLKPVDFYLKKYGSALYGLNKMHLLMEKQHNRGQDGAGLANIKLYPEPGCVYIDRDALERPPRLIKDVFQRIDVADRGGDRRRTRERLRDRAVAQAPCRIHRRGIPRPSALRHVRQEQHRERASRLAREQLDDAQSGTGRQFQPDEHRRAVPAPDRTGTVPAGDDRHRDDPRTHRTFPRPRERRQIPLFQR